MYNNQVLGVDSSGLDFDEAIGLASGLNYNRNPLKLISFKEDPPNTDFEPDGWEFTRPWECEEPGPIPIPQVVDVQGIRPEA